jgi:signal transduction histidine kinase
VLYLDSTSRMNPLSGLDEKILEKLALEAGNVFEKLEIMKTFEQRKSLELELALVHNELRAADALRRAEAQVLLSEYAASMGRFAAALSHELNSPLGALMNALQTCNSLAEKKTTLPVEKLREAEEIEAQMRRTALESAERLHQIVLRMQRFTNLDRNELLPIDLNSLLQDVADMLKSGVKDEVDIELSFRPLPRVLLRPQQMSAVFSNLLQNAIDGLDGGGHVSLATRQINSQLEVIVQDDGKGMSAEELATIFDPAFKVKSGRVSTGNWSLFSSRQIIREHGGEIEIQSSRGQGTRVRVTLPCLEK